MDEESIVALFTTTLRRATGRRSRMTIPLLTDELGKRYGKTWAFRDCT